MRPGKLITFEGVDGSGKSTQVSLLVESFVQAKVKAVKTREPGGVTAAEKIREILVKGDARSLHPVTEALLNFAARNEHLQTLILPELQKGAYVICDRFNDSTIAYQGFGHGLGTEYIESLKNLVTGSFAPDLTILLDIAPEKGLTRAGKRQGNENRFEKMGGEFRRHLREGFKTIAKKEPERFCVIDASQDQKTIHEKIIAEVNKKLGLNLKC